MSLVSTSNIRIGVVNFTFNGVNLGHTLDGVDIEVEKNYTDLTVDKYGSTPVDIAVSGYRATITARFAEPITELLERINPDGENALGSGGRRIGFGADGGVQLLNQAYLLTLHPTKNAAGDLTEDVVYYKAIATSNIAMSYKIDEQRVIEVEFVAVVDETKPSGRRLGHIGNTNVS